MRTRRQEVYHFAGFPLAGAFALLMILSLTVRTNHAAPLDLVQQPPDIAIVFVATSYDYTGGAAPAGSGTAVFTASGAPSTFQVNTTTTYTINPTSYALSVPMDVDTSGTPTVAAGGGTISIVGGIADLSIPNGTTLITGTIPASGPFGWSTTPGSSVFEFVFDVTGGALASYYVNDEIGVILSANAPGFGQDFRSDFTGSNGTADHPTTIPEPSFVLFWGSVLLIGAAFQLPRTYKKIRTRRAAAPA